jgi:tetratricopeptide (TPR) repeat protein
MRRVRWRLLRWVIILGGCGIGLWWGWSHYVSSPVARGTAAYRRGQWSKALELAQERLRTAKDDPDALRLLARASARLGRFPQTRSIYEFLGTRTLEAEDNYLLGLGLSLSNDYREAEESLKRAVDADPDHVEALHLFAVITYMRAQTKDAAWAAERLERWPGWEARANLLLGQIRAADHDPHGAVVALRRALRRAPTASTLPWDKLSTKKLLARSLLQTSRSSEALDVLRDVERVGMDAQAYWLLSRALLQEGRRAEAADAMARSGTYRAEHPQEPEPAPYIGEARCAECHRVVHKTVLASRHAATFRRGQDLAGLPLPDHSLADPDDPQVRHALKWSDERLRLETSVRGQVFRAVVDFALGSSDRYTSLVGRDDRGRLRTLRLSYHRVARGFGWDRTKHQKPAPERAEDFLGEPFESVQSAYECLICHTTSPRAAWQQAGPALSDRGIGCEQCHGPGGLHLAAVGVGFSDLAIASPAQAAPGEINRLCGACHSQHFAAKVMGGSRTSSDWARFPGSTLPWSRCYTESGGALSCVTCHDPHSNAETVPAYYEAKCLSCHATSPTPPHAAPEVGQRADRPSRSPCPINPSRDCLRCHMPQVRYEWLHGSFTDHYIRVHKESAPGHQSGSGT